MSMMSMMNLIAISVVAALVGMGIGFLFTRSMQKKHKKTEVAKLLAQAEQRQRKADARLPIASARPAPRVAGVPMSPSASSSSSSSTRRRDDSASSQDSTSAILPAAVLMDHSLSPVRATSSDGYGSYDTGGGAGGGSYHTGGADSSSSSSSYSSSSSDSSSSSSDGGGGGGGD